MSQLLRPAIIVALYALLLPVIGPALDHHYAEWQHNHAHLYFGDSSEGAAGHHRHIYDSTGSHRHTPLSDSPNSAEAPTLPEGIAYFTNSDGFGTGLIYAPTGPATQQLCFSNPGDCPLLAAFDIVEVTPVGTLIAPPRKPPTV